MRILVVRPGPAFSVADVARGWVKGLGANGCQVVDFNLDDRLAFYSTHPSMADDLTGAVRLALNSLKAALWEYQPDAVIVVSGFYFPWQMLDLIRAHHKLVLLHTESPYEDDRQLRRAAHADLNLINDPTNLDRFREVAPTVFMPHAYDPDIHHPRTPDPKAASDFCFVGTGYPSRVAFLEQVNWQGIDVALGGNWQNIHGSPLLKFLAHDVDECCDNDQAAVLYTSAKCSANLYRRETSDGGTEQGWAMGPREVELAACGTFYLRDPRPEGDALLPMLPTFSGPEDFGEQLRWWLANDDARESSARAARTAVAGRTFTAHAADLLRLLDA